MSKNKLPAQDKTKVYKNSHCNICMAWDNIKYKEEVGYIICKKCFIEIMKKKSNT